MTIESINRFRVGDKVRLKDGDGRPHIISSFEIDGLKEFFVVVYFQDGTEAMLDNISLPEPQGLDEAAHEYAWDKQEHHIDFDGDEYLDYGPRYDAFKAGAKWMAEQGVQTNATIGYYNQCGLSILTETSIKKLGLSEGDEVIIQIKKK